METLIAIFGGPIGFLKLWAVSRWVRKWNAQRRLTYDQLCARLRAEEERRSEVTRLSRGSSEAAANYLLNSVFAIDLQERRELIVAEFAALELKINACHIQLGNSILHWRDASGYCARQRRLVEVLQELEYLMSGWEHTHTYQLVEFYLNTYDDRVKALQAKLSAMRFYFGRTQHTTAPDPFAFSIERAV